MSVKPCLTLDVAPVVNGITWRLYSFNYNTADGNGSGWLYALSFEHAAARLAELKESAVLFDEVLGCTPDTGHQETK
ncbi:hypothetical protein [Pseudomonas chlororaphis]|uniref:hypothetical protein n=1 Tax=Pseudomonas chlororaphis TaxID=587753 RepID=UPI000F580147|nr:hypothetical protein [Pseudomonas chlororaphis]AZC67396.1 hypothetical protein C4K32_0707 [Pseudomonas chlororaphis subsp. piscium]MBP5056369.1 hypothetical protein [Pseudomonas chlororaphis]MBP5139641.1 hypothetical protein [Pseudomonas chlororaphis]QTT98476.1 hypothetical protein HUT26_04025 [Pseudomonas chlororaphis]